MKLQIDTQAKTIEVLESISLNTLMETLEEMFPNGAWKNYSLVQSVVYSSTPAYPGVGQPWWGVDPYQPPYNPTVTKFGSSAATTDLLAKYGTISGTGTINLNGGTITCSSPKDNGTITFTKK